MRILIAFGILFLGAMLGVFIISLLTKSKFIELSNTAEFHLARAEELKNKLSKLEEWAKPMLPIFGAWRAKK